MRLFLRRVVLLIICKVIPASDVTKTYAVEEAYLNKLFKFFAQSVSFYSKIRVYAFAHIEAYTLRENVLTLESQIKYKNRALQH